MRAQYRLQVGVSLIEALLARASQRQGIAPGSPAPGVEVVGFGGAWASKHRKRRFKAKARKSRSKR